jgi:DNA-binding transcriptional LysR family regulator
VTERYDAGIRLGEALGKDMIAVRIGPELRMAIVGSPAYFARKPMPLQPADLSDQMCINLRLSSAGGLYAWELEKDGREIRVRVEGQLAFNNVAMIREAALAGFGLGYVMEDQVADHVAAGRLIRVLEDWCPPFAGYHLYYTSRRQPSAAFTVLVEALRYRG